jgi:hypothetical protein
MASALASDIGRSLKEILPNLEDDKVDQITRKLIEDGLEKFEDVCLAEEADLKTFLKPFQCRKVLAAWATTGMNNRLAFFSVSL